LREAAQALEEQSGEGGKDEERKGEPGPLDEPDISGDQPLLDLFQGTWGFIDGAWFLLKGGLVEGTLDIRASGPAHRPLRADRKSRRWLVHRVEQADTNVSQVVQSRFEGDVESGRETNFDRVLPVLPGGDRPPKKLAREPFPEVVPEGITSGQARRTHRNLFSGRPQPMQPTANGGYVFGIWGLHDVTYSVTVIQ
jgi:hypothetical protein